MCCVYRDYTVQREMSGTPRCGFVHKSLTALQYCVVCRSLLFLANASCKSWTASALRKGHLERIVFVRKAGHTQQCTSKKSGGSGHVMEVGGVREFMNILRTEGYAPKLERAARKLRWSFVFWRPRLRYCLNYSSFWRGTACSPRFLERIASICCSDFLSGSYRYLFRSIAMTCAHVGTCDHFKKFVRSLQTRKAQLYTPCVGLQTKKSIRSDFKGMVKTCMYKRFPKQNELLTAKRCTSVFFSILNYI